MAKHKKKVKPKVKPKKAVTRGDPIVNVIE